MKNIAIFASGSGTNAENIARYFANSENVNVAVVLSNNRNVGVHGRVNKLGVPSFVFSREEFIAGVPILKKLAEYDVCLIVLAGFMNKISDVILQAFPGKIVNIHPALLPKYGGKGMYGMHVHEAVVKAGERESGITIHYINEHYAENFSLSDLAAMENLSVPYLSQFFDKYMGVKFTQYYNSIKLEHAVSDLISTKDSIETIAMRNGFTESHALSEPLKNNTRCCQVAFRKQQAQNPTAKTAGSDIKLSAS